jgi:4-hydroxybenzoate polyprenyltransferase
MLAYGRLLRLSLAPSAAADIAAGVVLASGEWPRSWRPWLLMLASLCVYHGGMAMNDWADRDEDARSRPGRPIPSGAIGARVALVLAIALLLAGPVLAFFVAPRCALALGSVSLLAALYDLAARGPLLGPLLLAACRAGNLSTGLFLNIELSEFLGSRLVHVVALYGLYVYCVSRLARLEDAPDAIRVVGHPRLVLGSAGLLLALVGLPHLLLLWRGADWRHYGSVERTSACVAAAIAVAGALGLVARSLRGGALSQRDVMAAVGMALRRLIVATAAIAAQAGSSDGLWVAAAILCGFPVSFVLRRVFPPT